MIAFSIIAAVMFIIAFLLILPPLFKRGSFTVNQTEHSDANLIIARERLQELKTDFNTGKIEQADFDLAKSELELNLAESLSNKDNSSREYKHNRLLILPLMILIPVIATTVYQLVGTPIALDPERLKAQQEMPDVEAMVAALAEKMQANPEDGEGWSMLGRSYVAMERFNEAEQAFAKAHNILGDIPSLLADYADAIGRGNNSDLTGPAKLLIEKSLSIDPQHSKSRWLAGMLAFQENEYEKVSEYLQPLLSQTEPGTELHEGLKGLINEARAQSGQQPVSVEKPVSIVSISVNVSLADSFKQSVSPDDTVFVFAKATQGPPIPLAVAKLTVKDLPITVTLNDAMAMRPDLKISMYEKVSLSARVSKTGNAIAASGDYEANSIIIATSTKESINLIIEHLIP